MPKRSTGTGKRQDRSSSRGNAEEGEQTSRRVVLSTEIAVTEIPSGFLVPRRPKGLCQKVEGAFQSFTYLTYELGQDRVRLG